MSDHTMILGEVVPHKRLFGAALPPQPIFQTCIKRRRGKLHAVVRLDLSHHSKEADAPIADVDALPQAAGHLIGGLLDYARRQGWMA